MSNMEIAKLIVAELKWQLSFEDLDREYLIDTITFLLTK